jgi:predicted acetyltransferase
VTTHFRQAAPDDVPAMAALAAHSFPGAGRSEAEWAESLTEGPHGGIETLWVGEDHGDVVAGCRLHAFRQWIGGTALPVMGLGLVAISPTHRRRGLAGRMVEAGFRHALERGDVASALYPFRISFYERAGYGLAGVAHQYQIAPGQLPDDPAERMRVHRVRTPADEADMRAVYAAAAARETGQMERTERSWRVAWGDPEQAAVVYRTDAGEPQGYAVVQYRTDLPPERRFLEVDEQAWLTPAARRGIYAWLASLGDQWRELAYRAHPEEGFETVLAEPRLPQGAVPGWGLWFPSATRILGPMFRILSVPGAFALRTAVPDVETTVVMELEDGQIEENRGPWRLRVAEGRIEAEPYAGGNTEVTLRTRVSVLSRIFIGATTATAAVAQGAATADRPERLGALDAALRVPAPWTFEQF